MHALPVKDSDDFNRLISALATDVLYASFHLKMVRDIWLAQSDYQREFAQSPTFWALTTGAHLETGLAKLARSYDKQRKGLHLSNWLETIAENLHLFSEENFRQRLKDNPFVDSLAETARIPDAARLAKDLAAVSTTDPDVKKLIYMRQNALAHRSGKLVLQGKNPFKEHGLSIDKFYSLAERAFEIVNRYTYLFRASSFAKKPMGNSDFIGTLALVRKGIDCLDAEYDAEANGTGAARKECEPTG